MARQKDSEFIPGLNTSPLDLCSPLCTGKVMVCVLFSHLVDETSWALRLLLRLKCKIQMQSENMVGLRKAINKNYPSNFLEYNKNGCIISRA